MRRPTFARMHTRRFRISRSVPPSRPRTANIYTGCNVESASYGLTVCAERVAIWKGISRGEKKFGRIAVVVDTEELTPPCGVCRQIIWEFCGDIPVILVEPARQDRNVQMSELLPRAFDSKFLK